MKVGSIIGEAGYNEPKEIKKENPINKVALRCLYGFGALYSTYKAIYFTGEWWLGAIPLWILFFKSLGSSRSSSSKQEVHINYNSPPPIPQSSGHDGTNYVFVSVPAGSSNNPPNLYPYLGNRSAIVPPPGRGAVPLSQQGRGSSVPLSQQNAPPPSGNRSGSGSSETSFLSTNSSDHKLSSNFTAPPSGRRS